MGFDNTEFKLFHKYCISKFGDATGNKIHETAENILTNIISESDYKNSKAIKWHMDKNMLPTIAMYLAFKETEATCQRAYDLTSEILQIVYKKIQNKNRLISKLPFSYSLFKMFCRSIIIKQYPKEGWHTEWVKYDNEEIHFNFTNCIYVETTKKYNCLELCPLFCANDDITLSGYSPNIIFERSETIGRGQSKCDFHFINGKYKKS